MKDLYQNAAEELQHLDANRREALVEVMFRHYAFSTNNCKRSFRHGGGLLVEDRGYLRGKDYETD